MIDRRLAIRLLMAAATVSAASLPPTAAQAQQGFQRFYPLLVDLEGWEGSKPDGVSMEIPGQSMTTAAREYTRGEARLNAQVFTGPAAEGALAVTKTPMKVETADGRMSTSTIDGLPVAANFTVHDKSGAIIVALAPNAFFNLTFHGMPEDEAMALAKKFNWKALQAAVPK
jgi:hypothetical protein